MKNNIKGTWGLIKCIFKTSITHCFLFFYINGKCKVTQVAPIIFLLDSRDFHGSLCYHLTFRLAGDLLAVIFLLCTDCPLGQKPLHLTPSHGSLPAFAKKVMNTTSLRVSPCPPLPTSRGSPHLKGNLPANLRLAIGQDPRTKEDSLMDCRSPYGKVSPESILSLSSASST